MEICQKISDRSFIFIVFLIQYIAFYELIVISPLAPDYLQNLGILTSDIGIVSGSFSLAAAISGIIAVTFIDNYDRKTLLVYCLIGILVGSATTIFASNFHEFLLAVVVKGMFCGPATTIALAMLSDCIPSGKRGSAVAKVMSSYPVVTGFAVPLTLEISHAFSNWRMALSINLIFIIASILLVVFKVPNFKSHIQRDIINKKLKRYSNLLGNSKYVLTLMLTFTSYFSGFLLIPHLINYFIFNLNFPRDSLALLCTLGGIISFIAMKIVGSLVDKKNIKVILFYLVLIVVINIYIQFFMPSLRMPIILFDVVFMMCMSSRNIVISAINTKVSSASDRASFLSLYNVCVSLGIASGGYASSLILSEGANLEIVNIEQVALMSIATAMMIPLIALKIEGLVNPEGGSSKINVV